MSKFEPAQDGINHINIYSKGKTALGRFLSHFAKHPIVTTDGEFASVEGYWYWLGSTHPEKERLRFLFGFDAKKVGKELRPIKPELTPEFKAKILEANRLKIMSSSFLEEFIQSDLPFAHYYVFGKGFPKEASDSEWLLEFWSRLRSDLQSVV